MYVLALSTFNDPETKEHQKAFGGYTDFPPNFREVTEQEFVQSSPFTYPPKKIEFRQMKKERNVPSLPAQLFFFPDGTGYALSVDYVSQQVQYYRFGCDHTWNELTAAECERRGIYHADRRYHVRECTKCTYINAFDSSD